MRTNRSWIVATLVVVGLAVGLVGLWRAYSSGEPTERKEPGLLALAPAPTPGGGEQEPQEDKTGETPELGLKFDRGDGPDGEKTMRFGLVLLNHKYAKSPTGFKQLTWHPEGLTSNACLKIDGKEMLFGHPPGTWVTLEAKLGKDTAGKPRLGRKSVWQTGDKIRVTQTVEIVRGPITGKLDTCRIEYLVENEGAAPRKVGVRYLLDTFIGSNDAAPFVVPGRDWLCEQQMQFPTAAKVPRFVFALEDMKLQEPGIAAQIGLRPAASEPPARLTLGGWPNDTKVKGAKAGLTLWQVPVVPLDKVNDSAAAVYWEEKELPAGGRRAVAFTYGLSQFGGNKEGTLGLFVSGAPRVGDELVVTALLKSPEFGQKVALKPSTGVEYVEGSAEQKISFVPPGRYPFSPITWRLRPTEDGKLTLRVESAGAAYEHTVEIGKK